MDRVAPGLDPHRGAYQRHNRPGTTTDAGAAAAHPGDHARVALHTPDGGQEPQDSTARKDGDRR
jgi:hypothetical protein